jgi:hypothetical protein
MSTLQEHIEDEYTATWMTHLINIALQDIEEDAMSITLGITLTEKCGNIILRRAITLLRHMRVMWRIVNNG